MKDFAVLYDALDATTSSSRKIAVLAAALGSWAHVDAAWLIFFFQGGRLPRLCSTTEIRTWVAEHTALPLWLVEESYEMVGDLAETIALLVANSENTASSEASLGYFVEHKYLPLCDLPPEQRKQSLFELWKETSQIERFLLGKLTTGGLRVGVSTKNLVKALSEAFAVDEHILAQRFMGGWFEGKYPVSVDFERLISSEELGSQPSKPYPFLLAYPLDSEPEVLGDVGEWQAEWKWDGVRAQAIKREGEVFLWSRGEELIGPQFPEIVEALRSLPEGTVLDGELLAWQDQAPLSFHLLQRRLGRKRVSLKMQSEVPITLVMYDLLEWQGTDVRTRPLSERRQMLNELFRTMNHVSQLRISETINFQNWNQLATHRLKSRDGGTEGLMLKLRSSAYSMGRKRGLWWKWKTDPLTFDAVLLYAQRGHGRRASVFSDYTFGVWRGTELVPVAKAYSGLTDSETNEVDSYIRANTVQKFGPVSSVKPGIVCEIACEGISISKRHKSGVAVRFPRIKRLRTEKLVEQADTLESLEALIRGVA
jgi:DNA ligase-1